MASQFDALSGILALVNAALSPGNTPITPYQAAVGYPSVGRLQSIAQGQPAAVSVYDRKISRNTTRWNPFVISQTVTAATLTSAVAPNHIAPGATARITLGGSVTAGDAVSALAIQKGGATGAVVAIGGSTDSPTTMATALAGLINSDSSMAGVLTASAAGPVVTVTNVSPVGLQIASYTGNGGTQTREIGRREPQVQLILWAQTVEIRNLMAGALQTAIANSEVNFGPVLADGTQGRLAYVSDYDLEDNTLEDVYRHDFMVSIEYPVTTIDALFAVLAPVGTYQVEM